MYYCDSCEIDIEEQDLYIYESGAACWKCRQIQPLVEIDEPCSDGCNRGCIHD